MGRFLFLLLSIFLLRLSAPDSIHTEAGHTSVQTVIARQVSLHAGPGDTYSQLAVLYPGHDVTVVERNRIGNWLRVEFHDPVSGDPTEGWVVTGALQLPDDFRLSSLPVNVSLPDADLSNVSRESLAELYSLPVIPSISTAMDEVYERGQAIGNHNNVISKIGDSVSASALYLTPLSKGEYDLGPYDYLEDTAQYFGQSLKLNSMAARIGLTSFSVFDPAWRRRNCQEKESPLACEYREKMPSVAFIMFGANDVGVLTAEQYETQMRQIVNETLSRGIIPVLSTFSADPDADTWPQAVRFNLILAQIADDMDVPLINLWAAARALPGYGLGEDDAHLTSSGGRINFGSGYESLYGVSLQNLLALVTLDEIHRTIIQPD